MCKDSNDTVAREPYLSTLILASVPDLVVDVALRVPHVIPEEARDERRHAHPVQHVVVDEPLLERLPVDDRR